ncbi:MAG: type II toxin-antitoxin system HicB family antitoxin [Saprospiraceae bacterium]
MKYLVVYEKANDGTIWARVPDLSGCYSCGNTISEAKANIKEAMALYIETAKSEGMVIPEPLHIEAELVKVV